MTTEGERVPSREGSMPIMVVFIVGIKTLMPTTREESEVE
jgi:hypothetical protein